MSDVRIEYMPLSAIEGAPRNPRVHALEMLGASIDRFGFVAAPVVNEATGRLVAGHGRVASLRASLAAGEAAPRGVRVDDSGEWLVPVQRGVSFASDHEAEAYLVADNRQAELASWDDAGIAELLRDHADAPEGLGYTPDDIAALISASAEPVDEDIVEPDADGPTRTTIGQIWALGEHRMLVGDSTDAAAVESLLSDCDGPRLWLVDPPFDLPYTAWGKPASVDVAVVWWRSKDALRMCMRDFGGDEWGVHNLIFVGGVRGQHNHTLPCCIHDQIMVWRRKWWDDKSEALDRAALAGSSSRLTVDGRHFSAQDHVGGVLASQSIGMSWAKPTVECEIAVSYVPRGSVVWDPCAGAGGGLLASEKHGRVWRGAELQPRWADLAIARWEKFTGRSASLLREAA